MDTRPTTDRIKETLFNILMPEIPGSRFLDLFAGSGGIGIEALSRGASEAVFVENNRKAAGIIRENLNFTKLSGRARVLAMDAGAAIRQLSGHGRFDLIFLDPPFQSGFYVPVLSMLKDSDIADRDSLIIAEAPSGMDFSFVTESGMFLERIKDYKNCQHLFIRKER